ncbi:hypothetical protein BDR26DRAFT_858467 [Obelidium mucronatum]|nr:hypothetical protein BDR26DRAFT_858467 [Obelidium mucronatum]
MDELNRCLDDLAMAMAKGDSRNAADSIKDAGLLLVLQEALTNAAPLALSDLSVVLDLLVPFSALTRVVLKDPLVASSWRNLIANVGLACNATVLLSAFTHFLKARENLNSIEISHAISLFYSIIQSPIPLPNCALRDIVSHEYSQSLIDLCQHLVVPKAFNNDLETLTDSNTWTEINTFQSNSPKLFSILTYFITLIDNDDKHEENVTKILGLSQDCITQLLIRCGAFLACPLSSPKRWSTQESLSCAHILLNKLVGLLQVSAKGDRIIKEDEEKALQNCVAKYAKRILESSVKPYFQKSLERKEETKKVGLGKQVKKKTVAGDMFNDQPWKTEFLECVSVFEWVLGHVKHPHMSQIQYLIVPTVLSLVDDYDPNYKTRGIILLKDAVLTNLSELEFRTSGLGNVFFETLRICLTYHSAPSVLQESFATITKLICTIEARESEAFIQKLSIVMEEGIVRGLRLSIGGKLQVIRAVLSAVPETVNELGIMTIKYLQPLVELTCEILELHQHDTETQILCCNAMEVIMCSCWPRINVYRGILLKAFATAWVDLDREDVLEKRDSRLRNETDTKRRLAVRRALKSLVEILYEICGQELLQNDFNVLLTLDKVSFGEFLPIGFQGSMKK